MISTTYTLIEKRDLKICVNCESEFKPVPSNGLFHSTDYVSSEDSINPANARIFSRTID